jgi:hypothetical protein
MIPKDAIKKAIKGGYTFGGMDAAQTKTSYFSYKDSIALDPSFWQSLGKALGWPQSNLAFTGWQNRAHDFYDLILMGGDTEVFWKDILMPRLFRDKDNARDYRQK